MAEEDLFFESDGLKIEALLDAQSGDKAVVIAHPHPLYGGDMHNHVVTGIRAAYLRAGYTTLRFNFRGVGASDGEYNEGRGETSDVRAAVDLLGERGKQAVDLAGYSFGAWVIARGLERITGARRVVMISPPVSFFDFSFLNHNHKIQLVIAGSEDDIAPADKIRNMVPEWNPEADLVIIPRADHFYGGTTGRMEDAILAFLEKNG